MSSCPGVGTERSVTYDAIDKTSKINSFHTVPKIKARHFHELLDDCEVSDSPKWQFMPGEHFERGFIMLASAIVTKAVSTTSIAVNVCCLRP